MTAAPLTTPLFPLGQIVATPGAIEATSNAYRIECLFRHMTGDWGCVGPRGRRREHGSAA